jgi:predicted ABC-type sugar transport system permease subunit
VRRNRVSSLDPSERELGQVAEASIRARGQAGRLRLVRGLLLALRVGPALVLLILLGGIPVKGVLVSVYVVSGLLAGVGAVITSGRLNAGSPTFGDLAELDAIAAVVIGGATFLGGRGHVGHALVRALTIGVIRNGMNPLDIEPTSS